MKNIIRKIMVILFAITIIFSGITGNVSADTVTQRIYGNDRIETSIKISQSGWEKGADAAVIAQAYGYADALCAGPLAKKYNAPILLSDKNSLSSSTLSELKRLKVKKVFLIGGSGVLSESIEKQLRDAAIKDSERLWGMDRYETSTKVAEKLGEVDSIVITSGNGYADSLSIASIAAKKGMPILLTDKDKLSSSVMNYIKNLNIKNSYVVGGTGVISENIEKSIPNAKRLSGNDRFETNRVVMKYFQNDLNFDNIFMAQGDGPTGSEFADALSGSAIAAQKSSPVVLIYKSITRETADFIKEKMTKDSVLIALGGKSVVPEEILKGVIGLFNGKRPATGIEISGGTNNSGGVVIPIESKDSFILAITRDGGAKTLKTKTIKVDEKKNAMQYLKDVADVAELQGKGFINGIDGLVNVLTKDLSISQRKKGILGMDWFIYLNGKKTPVGALGVQPKPGDTLNFDYREWDWRDLMDPGYTGSIPLRLTKVPSSVNCGQSIDLKVTCVYRGIYGAKIKVDGTEVATTDIDGCATITINSVGTHKISVEKDGGSAEKEIKVTSISGGGSIGGETPNKEEIPSNIISSNTTYGDTEKRLNIDKNITISADKVTLKNLNIKGDLVIDPGENGSANIDNVIANKIEIKSGANKSIHFDGVKANSLILNSSSNVRVETKGVTNIKNTEVMSNCILDSLEGSFGQVTVKDNIEHKNQVIQLQLQGNFKDAIYVKANSKLIAKTEKPIPKVNVSSDSKISVIFEGTFQNIDIDKEAAIVLESNTKVEKIEANANVNIEKKDKENISIGIISKEKDAKVEGDIENTKVEEKVTEDKPDISPNDKPDVNQNDKETFNLIVSRDAGKTVIKNLKIKVDDSKNAMDYLKSIAKVTELQGPGFINGVDGLLNVITKDLSTEQRKRGILGVDWFIYLNGEKTPVGALGVYPKVGDTLKFDYREWDWKDLMNPGYTGKMPINMTGIPYSDIYVGDSIKIKATCVYRGIYNAIVKVDGQQIAATDIDGYATITINTPGNHEITVEKEGGSKKKSVVIKQKSITPTPSDPTTEVDDSKATDIKLVNITDKINFNITKTNLNIIKIEGSSTNEKDSINIVLYDEKGNLAYINQSSNGKMNFNTIFKTGKYHGFVKPSSTEKVQIPEFEIK